MIKKFKCGLCKKEQYVGTRRGLRKHLKEEHFIFKQITNFGWKAGYGYERQGWWIAEEFI